MSYSFFIVFLIKSIGILPVALAMGSFLFLIFLLSYHTLQKSKREVDKCKLDYIEAGRVRYGIAHNLVNILQEKGDYLPQHDKMLSLGSTLMSTQVSFEETARANQAVQKEIDLLQATIANIFDMQQDTQVQNLLQDLKNHEKEYQIAYKKYAYNLKYYNNFVSKMPSKIVAKMTGFKKMP